MTPKSHWLHNSVYNAIAVMAFGLSQPSQAQGFVMPTNDYIKDQITDKGAFFKDDSIWTYTESFAKQFGMPPEGISPELQGLEAVAFRVERNHIDKCGMGGRANACIPTAFCMLDLYIDEDKHPLPWREPSQLSGWGGWYSSLFFIKRNETIEGGFGNGAAIGALAPFANETRTKRAYLNVKADRNIQNPDKWGEASYALIEMGFRRNIRGQLSLVTSRAPCSDSQDGPTARYLVLTDPWPTDTSEKRKQYFSATWSTQFATRMNDLKANAGRQFINSIKSAVPVLAPLLEGDKK